MKTDAMDAATIIGYFKGKSILITGSTGFLGKSMSSYTSYHIMLRLCISLKRIDRSIRQVIPTYMHGLLYMLRRVHAVLVEKILRVQPDVHKIYLLVRGIDEPTAKQRVQQEVYT
jgi:fatty acyl-CoA reductase